MNETTEIELGGEYDKAFVEIAQSKITVTLVGTNGTNIITVIPINL